MTAWIRVALYLLTGWLYGSGYIGEEVKDILTTDPAVVGSIEAVIAAATAAVPLIWWRVAKRLGWAT